MSTVPTHDHDEQIAEERMFLIGLLKFARGVTFFTAMCGVAACVLSFMQGAVIQTVLYAAGSVVIILFSLTFSRMLNRHI